MEGPINLKCGHWCTRFVISFCERAMMRAQTACVSAHLYVHVYVYAVAVVVSISEQTPWAQNLELIDRVSSRRELARSRRTVSPRALRRIDTLLRVGLSRKEEATPCVVNTSRCGAASASA